MTSMPHIYEPEEYDLLLGAYSQELPPPLGSIEAHKLLEVGASTNCSLNVTRHRSHAGLSNSSYWDDHLRKDCID